MDIIYRFDPLAPLDCDIATSNEEALQRLAEGNERFATMVERIQRVHDGQGSQEPWIIPVNPVTTGIPIVSGLAPSHAPYALVLGCSDARVPIEHILDVSANDLFVVRVAGNVLGLECLGSIDYAVGNLRPGLQSVVVLAHTSCGAVTAAVDIYLAPGDFGAIASSHAVRSLVDRIMLAVRGSARALDQHLGTDAHDHPRYREWLIDASVYANAAVTAWDLQREVDAIANGKLPVSYTVYDMAHARICSLPYRASEIDSQVSKENPPFANAPRSPEDLNAMSKQIVERIVGSNESHGDRPG